MKIIIKFDRDKAQNGWYDFEDLLKEEVKKQIGATKVSLTCKNHHYEGRDLYYNGRADGVPIMMVAQIDDYSLEVNPMQPEYSIQIDFRD